MLVKHLIGERVRNKTGLQHRVACMISWIFGLSINLVSTSEVCWFTPMVSSLTLVPHSQKPQRLSTAVACLYLYLVPCQVLAVQHPVAMAYWVLVLARILGSLILLLTSDH